MYLYFKGLDKSACNYISHIKNWYKVEQDLYMHYTKWHGVYEAYYTLTPKSFGIGMRCTAHWYKEFFEHTYTC